MHSLICRIYEHDHHPLDRKTKEKKRVSINKKPNNKMKHSKKTQHIRCMKPNNNKKQEDALYNCYLKPTISHLLYNKGITKSSHDSNH